MKGARLREKLFGEKSWESRRAFGPVVPLFLRRRSLKKAPRQLRLPGEDMAKVSVLNVAVLENPSPFHSPFRFEISFECSEALSDGEAGPAQAGDPKPSCPRFFAAPCLPGPALTSRWIRLCVQSALSRGGLGTPCRAPLVLVRFPCRGVSPHWVPGGPQPRPLPCG